MNETTQIRGFAIRGQLKYVKESDRQGDGIRGIGLSVGPVEPVVEPIRCVRRGDELCELNGSWEP